MKQKIVVNVPETMTDEQRKQLLYSLDVEFGDDVEVIILPNYTKACWLTPYVFSGSADGGTRNESYSCSCTIGVQTLDELVKVIPMCNSFVGRVLG